MKVWIAAGVAAVVLVACGPHNEAKEGVKKLLNDPDSAKFSEMQDGKNKGDVCGLVNAKNRMGGYVGNTPFFYQKSTSTTAIVKSPDDSDFRRLWLGIKAGDFSDDLDKVLTQCQVASQWSSVCTTPLAQPIHPYCAVVQGGASGIYGKLKEAYDR